MSEAKLDHIGYWSEIKLDIVKKYAQAYSKIIANQSHPSFYHVYIDAFAGAGVHITKSSQRFVPGSPLNALQIQPPFKEYHFIDLDGQKLDHLREASKKTAPNTKIHFHRGNCNNILLRQVFCAVRYKDYRRGLCLLDPYGLHLQWEVIAMAARLKTIEIFLNFPIMDINRNVLWHDKSKVDPIQAQRLTEFWGDGSWRNIAYQPSPQMSLFGEEKVDKVDNDTVAEAFQRRLRINAGFSHVPDPLPMRNSRGATVYYLFFASHKPVAEGIVKSIFDKYRDRGARSR